MTSKRILVALASLACVLVAAPAYAEQVNVHDPKGDAPFYDISQVTVKHRAERVRFAIHAYDRTPYGWHVFVDLKPGGRTFDYVVAWAVYTPKKVLVMTPKQFHSSGGKICTLHSGVETLKDVSFSVPTRCFGDPKRLRVQVKGWDDEAGYTDHTRWSEWADRA
jgi:hypothetical protein